MAISAKKINKPNPVQADINTEVLIQEKTDNIYDNLDKETKLKILEAYNNSEIKENKDKLEKLIFKKRPPTPEEFLDPDNGWIPPETVNDLFPHIQETFLDLLDAEKNYFQAAMYGSVRCGKSYMTSLIVLYTIIFIHHLREPGLYYNLAATTKLAIYFISFDLSKTRELYLEPMYEWMERSPRFKKVRNRNLVKPNQKKVGTSKIIYCLSKGQDIVSEIILASPLQIRLGNKNPNKILGSNLLQLYCSEIAYFCNEAGADEEKIFQLYSDGFSRIKSTMGNKYLAHIYLDTSANLYESKIERHIIDKLQFDKTCCFRWFLQWKCRPELVPIFQKEYDKYISKGYIDDTLIYKELYKNGFMFRVISGNGQIKAKLDPSNEEIKDTPKDIVHFIPIDYREDFENNLIKNIKDIRGVPSSKENKFIQDQTLIAKIFNNNTLRSNDFPYIVGSERNPENLIWDQFHHRYFYETAQNTKRIYRAPAEPRFLGIDHAYSKQGDMASISCCHPEFSRELDCIMAIYDFILTIKPSSEGINLSAIALFPLDLIYKGNLNIMEVSSDTFQSETMQQDLKRMKINVTKRSTMTSLLPYMRTLSAMNTSTIKAGQNHYLSNNLSCLEVTKSGKDKLTGKDQINHPNGNNTSEGLFGKDTSDSFAIACQGLFDSNCIPVTIYEEENKRLSTDIKDIKEVMQENARAMVGNQIKFAASRIQMRDTL